MHNRAHTCFTQRLHLGGAVCTLLLACLPLQSLAAPAPQNEPSDWAILGHGTASCQAYRKSIRTKLPKLDYTSDTVKAWADGYLTGADIMIGMTPDRQLVIPSISQNQPFNFDVESMDAFVVRNELWDAINDYCKANLQDSAFKAIQAYVVTWYGKHSQPLAPPKTAPVFLLPHLGSGATTCRNYERALRNPSKYLYNAMMLSIPDDLAAESWVQGYVTAINSVVTEEGAPLRQGNKPMDSINALKKYCPANPDKTILDFALQYVQQQLPAQQ